MSKRNDNEEKNKQPTNDKKKGSNIAGKKNKPTKKRSLEEKRVSEVEYLNIQDEEITSEQQRQQSKVGISSTLTKSTSSNSALATSQSGVVDGLDGCGTSRLNESITTNNNNINNVTIENRASLASDNSHGFARSESTTRLTDNDFNDNTLSYDYNSLGNNLTKNLIFAVLASTVGSSFQHGYNIGVMNAPEKLIGQFINETYTARHSNSTTKQVAYESQIDIIFSVIVSIYCIGGCIGALLTAFVADRIGRKEGLFYNNVLVLIACPMMASAKTLNSYELLIIGRLIIGINAGLNAGLAPLYLNEISPVNLRGALGTIYQLIITISIFLSNIFGLPNLFGTTELWPFLFAIPLIPAAIMLITLPHCCESPKHLLLNKGHELQAQQALAWFRGTGDIQEEMDDLRNENEQQKLIPGIRAMDLINHNNLRKPLIISIVIMLSQQFSGINAVLFFSTSIFRDAGLSQETALKATLGMSLTNVLMTIISLILVDRVGRKTLHMTGLMGMAVTCIILAVCLGGSGEKGTIDSMANNQATSMIAVISVYVFIIMFASGPGSIPWFLVSELFPSNARPMASSIAVSVNWLANFTVSLCFLPISNVLHGFTFFIFAGMLVYFFLFTYFKVPETKGATAEEISALFVRN